MSWGEPQQPPYDPNNPYGQQQPYPQPGGQSQPGGQDPSQQPQQPQQQPGWGVPSAPQPPYANPNQQSGGYTQPMPDPNNPYGQPPQNAYGAPAPYGQQPAYGQPGYGQPEYSYPVVPPKKSNNAKFVAIVVASVLVVGGGIAAAVVLTGKHSGNTPLADTTKTQTHTSSSPSSTGSGSSTLAAPSSVQGLTLLQNSVAQQAVTSMKSSLSADAELYPDPVLAAYNDGGGNDVTTILVDQAMADLSASDQASLTSSGSSANVVSQIMSGAGVSNAQTESTNASNGALSCGTKNESGTNVTICVWYDQTSFGTLQFLDGTSPSDAAPVADAVRAAAES